MHGQRQCKSSFLLTEATGLEGRRLTVPPQAIDTYTEVIRYPKVTPIASSAYAPCVPSKCAVIWCKTPSALR